MIKLIVSSFCAGIAISISCIAFLASGNPWTFPIGLFIICFFGFHLFTGKVSYANSKNDIINLVIMWTVNMTTAALMGILVHYMRPDFTEITLTMVTNKIAEGWFIIPRAILCNIMIFVAVHAWKNLPSPNNAIGLIFATAIFVICGFEHCVANSFYIGCALTANLKTIQFIFLNTISNAIGGLAAYRVTQFID